MKTRIMIERTYTDTTTGEQFNKWKSIKGWRLKVLNVAVKVLTRGL